MYYLIQVCIHRIFLVDIVQNALSAQSFIEVWFNMSGADQSEIPNPAKVADAPSMEEREYAT